MNIIKNISNETTSTRELKDIKMITLHHTGSKASGENILKFLKRKDYINVHYVVLKNGDIHHTVEDNHVAWHAGVSSWKGFKSKYKSLNWCSIGIEVHSDGNHFTDEQRESTRELINSLCKWYKIPNDLILRHKDIAPTRKVDIDDNFWYNEFTTWKDYQNSFNVKTMTKDERKTTEATISILSAIWSKLDANGKDIVSITANQLRKLIK